MALEVELIPAFSDNYIYLLRDTASDAVGIVDPGTAGPALEALESRKLRLTDILLTHHHDDHIGGVAELKQRYGARVVGPRSETGRIPGMDETVAEGDAVTFGAEQAQVFETPGHTRGHISLWFEKAEALFSGDTLFALGCGRLFEGTPQDMWRSLLKLRPLPEETRVYCGHEYTLSNAKFAVTVDPGNEELKRRADEIARLRADGRPTIPTTIGLERRTNPFLRADDPAVQAAVGMSGDDPVAVFGEIRRRKDNF